MSYPHGQDTSVLVWPQNTHFIYAYSFGIILEAVLLTISSFFPGVA